MVAFRKPVSWSNIYHHSSRQRTWQILCRRTSKRGAFWWNLWEITSFVLRAPCCSPSCKLWCHWMYAAFPPQLDNCVGTYPFWSVVLMISMAYQFTNTMSKTRKIKLIVRLKKRVRRRNVFFTHWTFAVAIGKIFRWKPAAATGTPFCRACAQHWKLGTFVFVEALFIFFSLIFLVCRIPPGLPSTLLTLITSH